MADKITHITVALGRLEQQYVEHKEKFEKWKLNNIAQCGTETYNKYVEEFNEWEKGVKEQQRQLIEERNSLIAPQDLDTTLDGLLAQISPKDFILAVVMMTSKDPTFFPALLSALQKVQAYDEARQASIYHAYAASAASYAPSTNRQFPSQIQYSSTQTLRMANPSHPYGAIRSDVSIDTTKRPYDRLLGTTINDELTARKSYRAPSPMALPWIHCNNCCLIPSAQNTTKNQPFALANCGHIFCSACLDKCVSGKICTVCGHSPFSSENVGRNMSEKTKKYFQTPTSLLVNALRKVNSVIKFQQNQYNIIRNNVNNMHEQMNNVADRCKETVKICDFLEKNASSLLTNMQQHRGMVQHLNGSFMDCAQSLKYFGDVNENVNTSRSTDLLWNSSVDNDKELKKSNSFSFRKDSFNNMLSLNGQNISKKAKINKPDIYGTDVDEDLSMPHLQSVKASGNLAAVFGSNDRSNGMNLNQSLNNSNPYMQYISLKSANLSAATDKNSTYSTTTQMKKNESNLQQLGSKRRSKVSENIRSSRNIFKMESNVHGIFNVHTHSLSRSPPHKNSRPDKN
ncbi:RING finger protein [Dirofilaria immitis]